MAAANPDFHVAVIGVNWNRSNPSSNDLMTQDRVAPWLQDTIETDVQSAWQAQYRDAILLDPSNERLATINLTSNDLGNPNNYDAFRSLLFTAAKFIDRDGDGLEDCWEQVHFGNLERDANDDSDHDGLSAKEEFMLTTNPLIPDQPRIRVLPEPSKSVIAYARRMGRANGIQYHLEQSSDLTTWDSVAVSGPISSRPFYDGSGAEEVFVPLEPTHSAKQFFRVRAAYP